MPRSNKPVKNVVIDTETLAIGPKAAAFQIGFAYSDRGTPVMREMSVNPQLYNTGYYAGNFLVDEGTVRFHLKTNPENYKKCLQSTNQLVGLAEFVAEVIEEAKEDDTYQVWLWACGTDFDIPIVNNLLQHFGVKMGIQYSNVRDYRTLRELYREEVPKPAPAVHSAAQDAWDQYKHLVQILTYLGKWHGQ